MPRPVADRPLDRIRPDLPGRATAGRDAEEATRNALEALFAHIEGTIEEGLLARIDRVAELRGQTRSAFLAEAARRMLAEGREAL
ncbi:MAG: type II toxin-antitoxin system HicB family antitoxin [Geminicoccaceae bacterium]|nr:type II toxin-antitoxin system HicB family antitoxin [Geminicoccaceae bacterium]MDW8342120.1 type II toxin-antitoxin system HicB family antitoxin [Geminicoccaceae bacterium]MDW8444043.1 type II toxin-antitoxin system HicB family antitoxin [Acetobacteraceae bacterium]